MSALDSAAGRLAARLGRYSDQRPAAPRGIRVDTATNWVSWDPPAASEVFTNYQVWIDRDDGDPDITVERGTRGFFCFRGTAVSVAAYNNQSNLASSKISVAYDFTTLIGSGGGCVDCSGKSDVRIETMTLDAAPDTVPKTSFTPCTGDQLCWKLNQDGSGNRTVAWDTQYENAPTTDINGTAGTFTLVRFVGINSKWVFDGTFITGLS